MTQKPPQPTRRAPHGAKPTPQPPGGNVQPEKHETIKTDRGEFKFREPKSSDWR